jgi:hypothetical protein
MDKHQLSAFGGTKRTLSSAYQVLIFLNTE